MKPVCIDDFGVALYRCRFTGDLVGGEGAVICGAVMPGVRARYVMGANEAAKAAKRESDRNFHESEANCNTCQSLERVPHEKRKGGFLLGRCTNPEGAETQYKSPAQGVIQFHPDDPMNMPCHRARWA